MSDRREHPHLPLVVVEDGLSSNGPHIALLKSLNMHFILGAKPGDHPFLFEWVSNSNCEYVEFTNDNGVSHQFKFINGVPLNDDNFDCQVNFLEYRSQDSKGKQQHFSWVSDIPLTEHNVFNIMKAGRVRWRIENETFNTLKNQGYNFEHNYGHGQQALATVLAMLMMLAFLIDQVQYLCSPAFQRAKFSTKGWSALWSAMRFLFQFVALSDWQQVMACIAQEQALYLDPG